MSKAAQPLRAQLNSQWLAAWMAGGLVFG